MVGALVDAELRDFFEMHIIRNLSSLIDCWQESPSPTLASLSEGIAEAAERLCATVMDSEGEGADRAAGAIELWKGADGMAASDLFGNLVAEGRDNPIDAGDMPQILRQLLEDINVHPFGTPHPRLAILGAVEARMHPAQAVGAHRLILAGFNEGNWPPRPDMDPWMNSAMRAAVGLPPKNWRSGLSAHDVYMAICSKDIIVTRADKEREHQQQKSRWLQRMEVVVNALGLTGDIDDGATEKAWLAKLNLRRYPNLRFGRHPVRHWQAVPGSSRQLKLMFGLLTPMQYMQRKSCNLNHLMILIAELMRRFAVFCFMMRWQTLARPMSLAN